MNRFRATYFFPISEVLSGYLKATGMPAVWVLFLAYFIGFTLPVSAQVSTGNTDLIDLSYSNPKSFEIGGISVTGVKFLDPNVLINMTGLRVGDEIKIPSEKISTAIKKLWETNILGDVQIRVSRVQGNLVFLELDLKERPRLSKFVFKGTTKGETDDLREKINLIRGRQVTDALLKNTQSTIKKFFIEKGFLNTAVSIKQEDDTTISNTVILKIDVDKKERVKVNQIIFEGNKSFSDLALRRKMTETKVKRFYRLFKSSKFIKANYEKDKKELIEFYNKQGYRDAQIEWDSVYAHDNKTVDIRMRIDEGPKYHFRDITWTGNYLYDDEVLAGILGIKKGDVYNMETLQRRLQYNPAGADISSLYMDDGYLFFNVDPVEIRVEKDSIDIEMRITEGSQATINKINIAGNTKTNDYVILREIRTLPGQKFSRSDIIRTQRELAQLGYFDPEQIGIQPVPNPANGTVDINYSVVERPSDQIELSGGWGGFFGFVGTLGLTFNNFSIKKLGNFKEWNPLPAGDGQRVALRVQANGTLFQTYSASFTEPWLGGKKPQSLTVSVSHSIQNQSLSIGAGRLSITSGTVSLGKRLQWPDDYFTLIQSANIQHYTFSNYTGFQIPSTRNSFLGEDFANGLATGISLVTNLSRNSINNPTFPTNGSNLALTVSLTPPYSLLSNINYDGSPQERYRWIEYHKWMIDASWFTPIAKNLVLNTRAHTGFLGTYNSRLGYSPFERFRVGGDGISGFNFLLGYDIIGLRGYPNNSIGGPRGGQAGIIFNKYVTELRYAISTNPAATIFALGFFEAGNNWISPQDFNPFNVYRSVGVGARIFMPAFGMIGVDYGYGMDNIPGTNQMSGNQFHFTIGQQIR